MSVYIDNFETIFGIKKNIQALRNKVLELAIQGKLVEQGPNDEPASQLIKRIQVKRDNLVKEGRIKKQPPFSPIEEDEIPFEIPESWEWIKSGDICDKINYGFTAPAKEVATGIKFLRITDIQDGKVNWDNVPYCEIEEEKIQQYLLNENDIVIARTGGTVGKSFIVRNVETKAVYASYLIRMIPNKEINPEFYYLLLNSPLYWVQLSEGARGGAQPNVNAQTLGNLILPLPPIAEQQRIVTKIQLLMSQIDKLEESLKKKEQLIQILPDAVVDAIGDCQTGEELKVQLQIVIENFETIFQTPDSMQELKNVVLQLAIEGKLVPQDPADEPALEIVKRIQVEKDKFVVEGKFKKQEPLGPIGEDEIPFEIPKSWVWVRFGDIVNKLTDGTHSTPKYTDSGVPFLSVKDMSSGYLDFSNTKYISKSEHEELFKRCNPERGDLLITKVGTTGIPVVVDTDMEFSLFVSVALVKFNQELLYVHFLKNFIKSPYVKKLSEENTRGVGNKNLVLKDIGNFVFPIPPLKEQFRIVAKVESIMSLIDQMEDKLKLKNDLIEMLAGG